MATDASMDQPTPPSPFPEEAMDAITAKLREVEAALVARARQFGTGFYCASPGDSRYLASPTPTAGAASSDNSTCRTGE